MVLEIKAETVLGLGLKEKTTGQVLPVAVALVLLEVTELPLGLQRVTQFMALAV
jgi:hypothetical protein